MAREKNLLTNLTLLGSAEQEPFAEVKVVTLHERAQELAIREAIDLRNLDNPPDLNLIGATDEVEELLDTKYNTMKEFVEILPDHILIGVDSVTIDDAAINKGLALLLEVPSLNQGEFWEIGSDVVLRKP